MNEPQWLAERFEEHRRHLRSLAYRILGSLSEADDAVQETWLRLSRANTCDIENLGGWLATVVSRVCLDTLRSRKSRAESSRGPRLQNPILSHEDQINPEQQALFGDSVGLALFVLFETLAPSERVAFALHDVFAMPFEEIATIVQRSPIATRQLASRARRRLRESATSADVNLARQRQVVDAFITAARAGDFAAVLAVLAR